MYPTDPRESMDRGFIRFQTLKTHEHATTTPKLVEQTTYKNILLSMSDKMKTCLNETIRNPFSGNKSVVLSRPGTPTNRHLCVTIRSIESRES